jgi:hypothetical protein
MLNPATWSEATMQRNPFGPIVNEATRRSRVEHAGAEEVTVGQPDHTAGIQAGANDPGTGAWRAAGITNITKTSDPFYSAKG